MAYTYRKQITITGQTNAGTGYQVLLLIGESVGSIGVNFHVEGHALSFPSSKNIGGDLAFYASDGITPLSFWVENVTGTTPNRVAKIWVNVSEDLGTNKNIFCYYGMESAPNLSNGDNTFSFFDDFDGSSLDTTKWTNIYKAVTISGSEIVGNPIVANPGVEINSSGKKTVTIDANRGISVMYNIRRAFNGTYGSDTRVGLNEDASNYFGFGNTSYQGQGLYTYGTARYAISQIGYGDDVQADRRYEAKIIDTSFIVSNNIGTTSNRVFPNTTSGRTFYVHAGGGGSDYSMQYINFIAIRRYIVTEPSFNTAGVETIQPVQSSGYLNLIHGRSQGQIY